MAGWKQSKRVSWAKELHQVILNRIHTQPQVSRIRLWVWLNSCVIMPFKSLSSCFFPVRLLLVRLCCDSFFVLFLCSHPLFQLGFSSLVFYPVGKSMGECRWVHCLCCDLDPMLPFVECSLVNTCLFYHRPIFTFHWPQKIESLRGRCF